MTRVYYFGCHKEPGHYMFKPGMIRDWDFSHKNPWGVQIDGGLVDREHKFALHHKDGWTAVAFDDFSIDTRPGSNSVFLAEGTFTLLEMLQLAADQFPEIAERCGIV